MQAAKIEQRVSLFRDGHHQAIHIPKEYELKGSEAIIRCEGNRLIIESLMKPNLLQVLQSLEPLDEPLPEIDDSLI